MKMFGIAPDSDWDLMFDAQYDTLYMYNASTGERQDLSADRAMPMRECMKIARSNYIAASHRARSAVNLTPDIRHPTLTPHAPSLVVLSTHLQYPPTHDACSGATFPASK